MTSYIIFVVVTTIYRLQGGKNTDRFRKPKWIWLLETLRILEKWMNLLNSMDLLNFIHSLFPTLGSRHTNGQGGYGWRDLVNAEKAARDMRWLPINLMASSYSNVTPTVLSSSFLNGQHWQKKPGYYPWHYLLLLGLDHTPSFFLFVLQYILFQTFTLHN